MNRTPAYMIIAAGLTLAACGSEPPAGSGQPGGSLTGEWTMAEATVDGEPFELSADRAVTLTVDGSDVSGSSACNTYLSTVAVDGSAVQFTGLGGTEMACEEPLMALEGAYLAALDRVREAANDGAQLVLTGAGVELRFDPVQPVQPSALVGTRWVLESVVGAGGPDGSVSSPVGDPATLHLDADGTVTGSTGCNDFGAMYELVGDVLELTDLAHTLVGCGNAGAAQHSALIAVLSGPASISIDGQSLTLSAPDGSGLVYRTEAGPLDPERTAAGWWLLRDGTSDGEPLAIGDHRIRLGLDGGRLAAGVGCNHLGAEIQLGESIIGPAEPGVVGIGGTDMLCPDLAELEVAYATALTLPLEYERSGRSLMVRGDHGELVFERLPDLAPADIVGRVWLQASLLDPDGFGTPSEGAGRLVLADDGTYAGTTGTCAYTGTYVIEGDQVTLTSATIDESACTYHVDEQGHRVFAAQGGAFVPRIDGDTMTIIGADGAGVVYVDERPTG